MSSVWVFCLHLMKNSWVTHVSNTKAIDHPDSLAEGLLDDDDDLLAQVNLQLQRESLVKKQRRDLVKPLSAKSSRSSSTDRGCCRIVADAISTFVQVTIELEDTLYFVL